MGESKPEIGGNHVRKPRTVIYVTELGGKDKVVGRIKRSIEIAEKVVDVSDKVALGITEATLNGIQPQENVTAGSYFDQARMVEEAAEALRLKMEQEQIGGVSGIHGFRIFVEPVDPDQAAQNVWAGLGQARTDNIEGLQTLYDENITETNYPFSERNNEKNINNWRILVATHKTKSGRSFKEWNNTFDPKNGKIEARSSGKVDAKSLFDVEVLEDGPLVDRGFEKIISDRKVGKVILFKNKDGKITKLEFWSPHFTCDEIEARVVMNLAAKDFREDENPPDSETNILRSYTVDAGENEPFELYDIETSYRPSAGEAEFMEKGGDAIGMKKAAYMLLGTFMGQETGKSGYVCSGSKNGSGLQFALMPMPKEMYRLRNLAAVLNFNNPYSIRAEVINKAGEYGTSEILSELQKTAFAIKEEISDAKEGFSTINILGAYLPELSRLIFKAGFPRQNSLIAQGSAQVSSVNHENERIQGAIFITALNISTDLVLAIKKDRKGLAVDLRLRTDEKFYSEMRKRLSAEGIDNPSKEQKHDQAVKMIEEAKREYRRRQALLSYLILDSVIKSGQTIATDHALRYMTQSFIDVVSGINNAPNRG